MMVATLTSAEVRVVGKPTSSRAGIPALRTSNQDPTEKDERNESDHAA